MNRMNIKDNEADYSIAFDPVVQPKIGEGAIYHHISYPIVLILFGFFAAVLSLLWGFRKNK